MEYINEFHKKWIERTRQSIASWSKQPISLEEKKKQQERLNYSFMGCCKAADVDFKGWMNYFLNQVHEYDSDYSKGKHPILGYHLSGERWRALAKKLCHKINDFYW